MGSIGFNPKNRSDRSESDVKNTNTVSDDILELIKKYKAIGIKIKYNLAEMAKPEMAMEITNIRSELSSLYLEVAAVGKRIIRVVNDDKHALKTLVEELNSEDAVKKLEEHIARCIENAKKYGSSIKSDIPKTTLDDIKGQDDVKDIIRSFVYLAQHPDLFATYKLKGGLGIMMYGAPGTGKTMFAEAIAHEMGLPLFVVTPADIFKSYVGASEQAVRQIFQDISSCSDGAVLFVDECESIFTKRSADTKETKSAVTSELLQRMNGEGVDGSKRIMIAATNRPWDIDPAYLRYKRFSHLIHIAPPDKEAIAAIVKSKLKGVPCEEGVVEDLSARIINIVYPQARSSSGETYSNDGLNGYYSAADICGIIEEACRMAIEQTMAGDMSGKGNGPVPVSMDMLELAIEKRKPSISAEDMEIYQNFTPDSMNDK